ncbi:sugar lactone lactonase YvrE [Homoserinimonas aerilata]|uniref:Sugar lactone lactonase YvrE n=1 Tax=Homoserinimonas aerilata TaxID=1162970 RepID=A0A542YEP5_9MICO|nr:SMP-30/gluconolactonase/LRE family protein [Homoserinimonas aerilata]TQL46563.1 sugar lactone lactonase YvrE [Homoserinimonas aerilata]
MTAHTEILLEGLRFPEGCRWHDGQLWFSDMHSGTVHRVDADGSNLTTVMTVDDRLSGIDWLPDGSLVVSGMLTRKVYRLGSDGEVTVFADLSAATPYPINDLIRMPSGSLLIGGFGYDLYADEPAQGGPLIHVDASGAWSVVADDLTFPNGMVLLTSGELVVAETFGSRLTAYDVDAGGRPHNKRLWAELPEGSTPDGLCRDSEDAIWVSSIVTKEFLRVTEGGTVTDVIDLGDRLAVDCVLGGEDGRSLLLSTANSFQPDETEIRAGRIERIIVDVPGETA